MKIPSFLAFAFYIARMNLLSDEVTEDVRVVDLHALQHVEEVIHARQMLYVLEDGNQQGGSDGQGAGQQHPSETRPAQVQEALRQDTYQTDVCNHNTSVKKLKRSLGIPLSSTDLHDKLTRVCPGHGGALTSCQDAHGPDVERCGAKEAAQHHPLQQTARGTVRQHKHHQKPGVTSKTFSATERETRCGIQNGMNQYFLFQPNMAD